MNRSLQGNLIAITAFAVWGLTPMFYGLLEGQNTIELLVHRIFWSVPLIFIFSRLISMRYDFKSILADKVSLCYSFLAASVMCVSWYAFIYAVTHQQVLTASLGFFINPLITIVLSIVLLKEKPTTGQAVAIVFSFLGVSYLIITTGKVPILALLMGGFFALYGVLKKGVRYDAMTSVMVESVVLFPFAAAALIYQGISHSGVFFQSDLSTQIYFMLTAPMTLVPVILFSLALRRTSLTSIGLIQYLEPSLQFMLATLFFGELLDVHKLVTFSFIWVGLLCCMYPSRLTMHVFRARKKA
ncbi:EamA family transporter [Shewanella surugensis]|uniref:EamA family transporter n=1 Tax=Shewanella surugensis TaxID=212020 RepID=A0ABT0LII0_9GAMM|nr:EamA family transporter [Shewanella surugensis]MCL1127496.1 EamA family transporter [Shewanella surugensis]